MAVNVFQNVLTTGVFGPYGPFTFKQNIQGQIANAQGEGKYSGCYLWLYNDTDAVLQMTMAQSGQIFNVAQGGPILIPLQYSDYQFIIAATWPTVFSVSKTQSVWTTFLNREDFANGYDRIAATVGSAIGAIGAAQIAPGLLPFGVDLSTIRSDPVVAGVDANWLITSDGAGNVTFHLISGHQGALFWDFPGASTFANILGFGANCFFGMFATSPTQIQAQFAASDGVLLKNTATGGANEQVAVHNGVAWLAATLVEFRNAAQTYDARAVDDGTVMYLKGGYFVGTPSVASNTLINGSTITTAHLDGARVTEAAAVTGIIMQAGTVDQQMCWVINQGGFSITMAAAGTSNVADGVACVIATGGAKLFRWNAGTALWYHA